MDAVPAALEAARLHEWYGDLILLQEIYVAHSATDFICKCRKGVEMCVVRFWGWFGASVIDTKFVVAKLLSRIIEGNLEF